MKILTNLLEIVDDFEVIVLDAYGVFWGKDGFLPGTQDVMHQLMERQKIVVILSNSTESNAEAIEKYSKRKLLQGFHYNMLIMSGEVAKRNILGKKFDFPIRRNKYYVFRKPRPSIFEGSDLEETQNLSEADFIYIGIPRTLDDQDSLVIEPFLDELRQLIKFNLPMFCANPDLRAYEKLGLVVRQGLIAKTYEEMGGEVQYCGKPYQQCYEVLKQEIAEKYAKTDTTKMLMVGDTLRTDIMGGYKANMKTCLIVKTGVTADEVFDGSVVDEARLKAMFKEEGVTPDFIIEKMAC